MPQVKCPACDKSISLKESHFGRRLKCKCGQVFRAPEKDAFAHPTSTPTQSHEPIQFSCPTCMTLLQVGPEMAGTTVACPCGTHVAVPLSSSAPIGLPPADPFGFPASDAGGLPPMQTPMLQSSIPPSTGPSPYRSANAGANRPRKRKKKPQSKPQESGNSFFEGEILGGAAMMIGAVVWFGLGLAAGYIFFYPPILFVIGLGTLIKGLFD